MLIRSLAILIIGMLNALASPAGAIVGGEPDTSHRNVAALVTYHPFLPGNPLAPLCSGTLIAPDVVVTAGHFAGFIVGFGLPAWVTFDEEFSEDSPLIAVTAVPHPGLGQSPNGLGGDPHEVGVLLLDEPTDQAPATLPTAGLLDDLKEQKVLKNGLAFTIVGYGATGLADGLPDNRRTATLR